MEGIPAKTFQGFASRVCVMAATFMLAALAPAAWGALILVEGTSGADVIDVSTFGTGHNLRGRGGADLLTGSSAGDIIDGGYGYDRLFGGGGADLLIGGPGNDAIDGGSGIDDARYAKSRASYAVTGSAALAQVRALSGSDGTDTVKNVEFVTFADGRFSMTELLAAPEETLLGRIVAAPEASWLKVNANRFDSVWTPLAQRARANGTVIGTPAKIINAWSSMAWDANRRQLIIWGGGHANYAGNDVYRFDAATLRWQRAALPSAIEAPSEDRPRLHFAVDGPMNAPISSHTYDNQEFLPLADRFITFGGAAYNTGGPFLAGNGVTKTGPYLWDPSRAGANSVGGTSGSHVNPTLFPNVLGGRMWNNRNTVAINGIGAARPGSFVNGTSAYVLEQGVESILVSESPSTGGDLFRYRITDLADPTLDRWQLMGPGLKSYADQGAGAYDPNHRLYLRTARLGTSHGLVMWNLAIPGATNYPIRFTPPSASGQFVLSRLHGMDFDPRRGVFVLWAGDRRVWYLKPPASGPAFSASGWTVTAAPVNGFDSPTLTTTTGVLGKWKYLATHDVMLGLGHGGEGQVWIYKPSGWQPP
jgi:hypothetical protein